MERPATFRNRLLPGAPEDVDAAFIRGVLATRGMPNGVIEATWRRIGTDRGISSLVGRVHLAYDGGAGGPASLIVKLAPEPVTGERDLVEIRFYRELAGDSPLGAPRCLFAGYDLDAGRSVLVLEDLDRLESPGDVAGLTPAQARLATEALASFHAKVAPVAETRTWTHSFGQGEVDRNEAGLRRNLAKTLERSSERLSPAQLDVCRRLPGRVGEMLAILNQTPRTLAHHDFRADNLFFGPGGRVVAVDWEGVSRFRGGFDLGMFLGTSLPEDDFDRHAGALVSTYANHVRLGGFDYAPHEVERDVRVGVLFQLVWACSLLPEPVLGTGRPLRVVETWLDRLTHAAIRLDAFAALAGS